MSPFLVSVVIPLYNKAPFIRRTLESVLAQTLAPAEIIIVDDGSTDGSIAAIADLIGDRVRLVSQVNAGPGPTRNRGAAEATQEWIALIDGDDMWLPAHLETLAELNSAVPTADVLVNDHYDVVHDPSSALPVEDEHFRPQSWDFFGSRGGVHTSSLAIRRSAYRLNKGFGNFCPGEDTDFWFRLALNHEYARSYRKTGIYFRNTDGLMDVYDKSSATYELPELFSSLQMALDSPQYENIRDKILFYRDCILLRSIKLALYQGDRRRARVFLKALSAKQLRKSRGLRALSLLPGGVVRRAAISRTRIISLISLDR